MTKHYFFGEWKNLDRALNVDDIKILCQKAEEVRPHFSTYPRDQIFEVLDRVRNKWKDPMYPQRKKALEQLPSLTGFSKEMIELGLAELDFIFCPKILEKKIKTELKICSASGSPSGRMLSWSPLGTLLHVLSGNVFLVGAGSLVEGLLTNNVSILKMSSQETLFLPLLVESFQECDPDGVVSRSFAAIQYESKQKDVIQELKNKVDGIVIWGGEEAVKNYRDGVPARTRVIVYGPKLSLALVTEEGLKEQGLKSVAEKCAQEISVWDQNACTAPQVCYVLGLENAKNFVDALSEAMVEVQKKWPAGNVPLENAVEIQKQRSRFEIADIRGEGAHRVSEGGLEWSVFLDFELNLEPSPLHRTLRVVPFNTTEQVLEQLREARGYVQTVGLCAGLQEQSKWFRLLAKAGALRILSLGSMSAGEIDDPHDGAYDLRLLMNLVVTQTEKESLDFMEEGERRKLLDERLRVLVREARKSSYYEKILEGIEVKGIEDLSKIPILKRSDLENNMPPLSHGLATKKTHGGYVTRSGGSTGTPKFSYYDAEDWESMIVHALRAFRAMGLTQEDRVANFMLAGDLYGSFVSFDHVICRLQAMQFPFAGKVEAPFFLKMAQDFGINVAMGIPSFMIPLLREVKKEAPSFTLEKVIYAGVPLSDVDRKWLKEELKVSRVASVIGANDGGGIAFQCGDQQGGLHHLMDEYNYVETVEDGKILITSLNKFAYPLIRYEIGDKGRILDQKCTCGRTSRVLEFLGRADEVLCIGVMNLALSDLRKILNEVEYSELQLVGSADEKGEKVTLNLEISEEKKNKLPPKIIRDLILDRIPKIKESVQERVLQFEVKVHDPGSLERNSRTGKLKSILDKRVKSLVG